MQRLTAPPRDGLTEAQVRDVLTSDAVEVAGGVMLLDGSLNPVQDISDDLRDGKVERNCYAQIHGRCTLSLSRELSWGTDLLQPYVTLTDRVSGTKARFNLGVYALITPDRGIGETPETYEVAGLDRVYLLDRQVGDSYEVGTVPVLQAVRAAFLAAGFPTSQVLLDGTASDTVLPAPMVWPVIGDGGPTTWLRIVNDLLRVINYRGIYCVARGSAVTTDRGQVPIEDVRAGADRVWTRQGWRLVTAQRLTKKNADTLTIKTSDGHSIQVTSDHPIWTEECGWTLAGLIRPGMTLSTLPSRERRGASSGQASAGTAAARAGTTPIELAGCFTSRSGSVSTADGSPTGTSSITSITTLPTTPPATWLRSPEPNTLRSTASSAPSTPNQSARRSAPRNARAGRLGSLANSSARTAVPPSSLGGNERATAPAHVAAPSVVLSVEPAGQVDVFDLSVEGAREFYAEGVLVHNCDENGLFRSEPYAPPTDRGVEWEFDADDPQTVVLEDRTVVQDLWRVPNRWVFLRRNMEGSPPVEPVDGAGRYEVENVSGTVLGRSSAASMLTSQTARELVWTETVEYDAASQDALVGLGQRRVEADLRGSRHLRISTGPFPVAGHFDVFTYRDSQIDSGELLRVQARSWSFDLTGDSVEWEWEVVA